MAIQWFPGHMTSARKKAAESMERIDVVIEVLDARLPEASSNPMIREIRQHRQRPCLKVLNKADLADPAVTKAWIAALEAEGRGARQGAVKAVALSLAKAADVARVVRLAAALAPHRGGPEKPLRLMAMGIPNVGKSTLINGLLRRRVAAVGDEPAITRQVTRYELPDRTVLFDSPGLMWPAIARAEDGLMLAASHAIGVNAYIDEEVATWLAVRLRERYPDLLAKRYGIDPGGLDGPAIIEAVAARRGMRVKGGAPDLERAGLTLIGDYRSGALGRISLERPEDRAPAAPKAGAVEPEVSP